MTKRPTPPTDGAYTSTEVVALAGITYRQLDHWARTGIPRHWDRLAALEVVAVARLRAAGLDLAHVRRLDDPEAAASDVAAYAGELISA